MREITLNELQVVSGGDLPYALYKQILPEVRYEAAKSGAVMSILAGFAGYYTVGMVSTAFALPAALVIGAAIGSYSAYSELYYSELWCGMLE